MEVRGSRRLIGRDDDLDFVHAFLDAAVEHGGALLLSGEAGVGKTAVLDSAAEHAADAEARVLRGGGAQFEVNVSFAGLNQLFQPVLDELDCMADDQQRALRVALGLEDGAPPGQLVVLNAALALLVQAAQTGPIVVIIDDLPWLDRASAAALGFIARRLHGSRVGLLAACRSGEEGFFERAGLSNYELDPLGDDAASDLLQERFPALTPRVRQRLMDDAQGNPLALLELPAALTGQQRSASSGPRMTLPLSGRLQALFASRVGKLPESTREVLLLAVLDGTSDLHRLSAVAPGKQVLEALAPAERAQLVTVDEITGEVVFRHPLTGSAVVELATAEQRREAHKVLADHLPDRDERRAWHLAAATMSPDQAVAGLLDRAAAETLGRGDPLGAVCTLLRSAQVSPAGADRSRRLAEAAYLGAVATGDLRDVPKLLEDARQADLDQRASLASAVAAAYHLISGSGDVNTAHTLLVGALDMSSPDGDDAVVIEALHTLLLVCFFGAQPQLWDPFDATVKRLLPEPPELLTLLRATFTDPARTATAAISQLDEAIAGLNDESSPARITRVAMAGAYLDRLPACSDALWRAVEHGRAGGAITSQIEALFLLGNSAFWTGEWDGLAEVTDEGLNLCEEHGYKLLSLPGTFLRALVAAARGHDDTARALAEELAGWATPRGLRSVQHYAWHIRTLAALGRSEFEAAFQHAAMVSPTGTLASHVPHALWLVMDLVEAAVRTGRHEDAAAHVTAARAADLTSMSSRLALVTHAASAMVAPEHHEAEQFENALAVPGADRWPFDLARVQLAYGERLRRSKHTSEARQQLRAALETFQRLEARPWKIRAGNELRATGLSIGVTGAPGPSSLTPQQLEIAHLAAAGLTNKEIGERLFLSHRTVGTHLYQLFPKLGVTSRAALRDALGSRDVDHLV